MKKFSYLIILILVSCSFAKTKYMVEKRSGQYEVAYMYNDFNGRRRIFIHSWDRDLVDKMMEKYGNVNESELTIRYGTKSEHKQEKKRREKLLAGALLRINDDVIGIDHQAVINYYAHTFCKPIADHIISELRHDGLDSYTARVKLAVNFCQNIPYRVPKAEKGKIKLGFNTPADILIKGFGDCDSKSVLLAGILRYLTRNDAILISYGKHMIVRISTEYSEYYKHTFRYKKKNYVPVETTSPRREFEKKINMQDEDIRHIVQVF